MLKCWVPGGSPTFCPFISASLLYCFVWRFIFGKRNRRTNEALLSTSGSPSDSSAKPFPKWDVSESTWKLCIFPLVANILFTATLLICWSSFPSIPNRIFSEWAKNFRWKTFKAMSFTCLSGNCWILLMMLKKFKLPVYYTVFVFYFEPWWEIDPYTKFNQCVQTCRRFYGWGVPSQQPTS